VQPYLLNLVYLLVLLAASPWLLVAAFRKGKYREGFRQKLLGRVPERNGGKGCIWLHAVSVGEVSLIGSLIRELSERRPDLELVLSTTTMTGYRVARQRYGNLSVFYCPLDFSWAVRNAMRRLRPDLLVLVELELWPNLVRAAREVGARVAVVNARLGERSHRGYRRIRPFVRRLLAELELIAAQDQILASRFLDLGAPPHSVRIVGSMKYDGAETNRQNEATVRLRRLAGLAPDDVVFVAGSTQDPEEAHALEVFQSLADAYPRLKLVIVPRHPDRFDTVAHQLSRTCEAFVRRSRLDHQPVSAGTRVLLVDAVGELKAWWGTADIAYVGGSLTNRGGQNMIEPAAYGAAVSFGPNTWNFRDIVAHLLAAEAAVVVRSRAEIELFVRRCLDDPTWAVEMGNRARSLVLSQQGATGRTVDLLETLLPAANEQTFADARLRRPAHPIRAATS
jgi:3-deoxy-D-manno-octulosonic-acid transferase